MQAVFWLPTSLFAALSMLSNGISLLNGCREMQSTLLASADEVCCHHFHRVLLMRPEICLLDNQCCLCLLHQFAIVFAFTVATVNKRCDMAACTHSWLQFVLWVSLSYFPTQESEIYIRLGESGDAERSTKFAVLAPKTYVHHYS